MINNDHVNNDNNTTITTTTTTTTTATATATANTTTTRERSPNRPVDEMHIFKNNIKNIQLHEFLSKCCSCVKKVHGNTCNMLT